MTEAEYVPFQGGYTIEELVDLIQNELTISCSLPRSLPDAKNWTHIDTNPNVPGVQDAPWSGRIEPEFIVFQNKMYLLGGGTNTNPCGGSNDVWVSSNGSTWTHVDTNPNVPGIQDAPWSGRMNFSALVYNSKLWVMGGYGNGCLPTTPDLNDVWSSVDGANWIQVTQNADWSARTIKASVVFNGKMWVFGGTEHSPFLNLNDAWYSTNGINWTSTSSSIIPPAQFLRILGAFVLNNKIHIIAANNPVPIPAGDAFDDSIYTSINGISFGLLLNLTTPNTLWATVNGQGIGGGYAGWGRQNFAIVIKPPILSPISDKK